MIIFQKLPIVLFSVFTTVLFTTSNLSAMMPTSIELGSIEQESKLQELSDVLKRNRSKLGEFVALIQKLHNTFGLEQTVELLKRFLAHEQTSLLKIKNAKQETVLHVACRISGYLDCVKIILLAAGEDVFRLLIMQDKSGDTPLHTSIFNYDSAAVCRVLLSAHKDTTAKSIQNCRRMTALDLARKHKKQQTIVILEQR